MDIHELGTIDALTVLYERELQRAVEQEEQNDYGAAENHKFFAEKIRILRLELKQYRNMSVAQAMRARQKVKKAKQ